MTIEQILNMDSSEVMRLYRKNPKEFRKLTSQLNSAAKKRIQRAEKQDITPPAIQSFKRSGGIETIRGKDIKSVRTQFQKLRGFLLDNQSTVGGTKAFVNEVKQNLGLQGLTNKEIGIFLDIWSTLKETHGDVLSYVGDYTAAIKDIKSWVKAGKYSTDEIIERAKNKVENLYLDTGENDVGTGDFFTLT